MQFRKNISTVLVFPDRVMLSRAIPGTRSTVWETKK